MGWIIIRITGIRPSIGCGSYVSSIAASMLIDAITSLDYRYQINTGCKMQIPISSTKFLFQIFRQQEEEEENSSSSSSSSSSWVPCD